MVSDCRELREAIEALGVRFRAGDYNETQRRLMLCEAISAFGARLSYPEYSLVVEMAMSGAGRWVEVRRGFWQSLKDAAVACRREFFTRSRFWPTQRI